MYTAYYRELRIVAHWILRALRIGFSSDGTHPPAVGPAEQKGTQQAVPGKGISYALGKRTPLIAELLPGSRRVVVPKIAAEESLLT